jgi:hypothetical protein
MTEKRGVLVIGQGLIGKIDDSRGELSRSEFIDFCIDRCLEEFSSEEVERKEKRAPEITFYRKDEAGFATREEFEEFRRGITDLLGTFLDFYISFGLELGRSRGTEDLEQMRKRLRRMKEQ